MNKEHQQFDIGVKQGITLRCNFRHHSAAKYASIYSKDEATDREQTGRVSRGGAAFYFGNAELKKHVVVQYLPNRRKELQETQGGRLQTERALCLGTQSC